MNFFGTDGIRGTYGSTITDSTAFLLGKSLALLGEEPVVIICRDTRESGAKLFNALALGVYSGGGNVINLGILPTNSVGHFVRKFGADYGVMISASHNPPCDNGLKVFDRYGVKLCGSKQDVVSDKMNELLAVTPKLEKVAEPVFYDIDNIYCQDVKEAVAVDLFGMKIALDCCYGSAYKVAGKLFESLGAKVTAFGNKADGKQINLGCGATNTLFLSEKLAQGGFDLGFSFDGDCDRLAVFEGTQFVSNSKVFFAMARYMKETGKLKNDTVCGTVLTNGGVEKALEKSGIKLLRSDVGDVNIFNLMAQNGLNLGGEESGHYLLTDFATSSDALINALFVCKIFKEKGSIIEYAKDCTEDVCCKKDVTLDESNANFTAEMLNAVATRVNGVYPSCRIVLRKSGTEPKIRAYAEGENCEKAIEAICATIVRN